MKRIPALLFIGIIVLSACSSNNTDKKATEVKSKYEETKETLADTEKKNPVLFLKVDGHDKRNLIGQTVVKGTLTNSAKVASYKDVELRLSFYSKTGSLLEEDAETVFESIGPGKSVNFKTKYFAPKGTDSVALKVMNAKTE
ncbi:FxLYD domain-containing protein [Ferruginibacter sp.]